MLEYLFNSISVHSACIFFIELTFYQENYKREYLNPGQFGICIATLM